MSCFVGTGTRIPLATGHWTFSPAQVRMPACDWAWAALRKHRLTTKSLPSLKLTALPLKMDSWNISFLLRIRPIFRGYVSFGGAVNHRHYLHMITKSTFDDLEVLVLSWVFGSCQSAWTRDLCHPWASLLTLPSSLIASLAWVLALP